MSFISKLFLNSKIICVPSCIKIWHAQILNMYNILKYIFFKTPKTAYSVCQFPVEKTDVSGQNTKWTFKLG